MTTPITTQDPAVVRHVQTISVLDWVRDSYANSITSKKNDEHLRRQLLAIARVLAGKHDYKKCPNCGVLFVSSRSDGSLCRVGCKGKSDA